MLEGMKINMNALKSKPKEPEFKSALNFATVGGTGIPAAYKNNHLVQKYESRSLHDLAEGWKIGIGLKKPTEDQKAQFAALVIVMKYKYGVEFPHGKDKI